MVGLGLVHKYIMLGLVSDNYSVNTVNKPTFEFTYTFLCMQEYVMSYVCPSLND